MKDTIEGHPTDKSSDEELSVYSAVIEFVPEVNEAEKGSSGPADAAHQEKSSKRRRLLWGVGGLILIIAAATAAVLATRSSSEEAQNESNFDFSGVAPGTGSVVPSSPIAAPASMTAEPSTAMPSDKPSLYLSNSPTGVPSSLPTTAAPTPRATNSPTRAPAEPTIEPTMQAFNRPPFQPLNPASETFGTFCVIADVPYFDDEKEALPGQIDTQMEGCEFLVHLGDIMEGDIPCDEENYILLKNMLLESSIPAFIIPGDNEVRIAIRRKYGIVYMF